MNFKGQFAGILEAARKEKLRLLINLIEEHKIVGIASAIPHNIFFPMFGNHSHKYVRNPYFISFYGIAGRLIAYLAANGIKEKVEFIFDFQPGSDQSIPPAATALSNYAISSSLILFLGM